MKIVERLPERLECAFVEFPGYYSVFECEPITFAPVLKDVLDRKF